MDECEKELTNVKCSKNKTLWIIAVILILCSVAQNNKQDELKRLEAEELKRYEALPIRVDITMTNYFGTITAILNELKLDFELVTMGANCYTGVQKNEFYTEEYGLLHTEFRYCKSNYTQIFRVYNTDSDQELRDGTDEESLIFNPIGIKETSN